MSVVCSIIGFILGFGLVFFTIPAIIRVSVAKRLYDTPNDRKVTQSVVPTLGGVSIFIGFILSSIVATDGYDFKELKYLIAAVIMMFFLGLKDDLVDISALKKLFVQLSTSTMLITFGDIRFTNLHGIFGFYEISYPLSFAITLFIMIALINSFNLIDGIDGLASGISVLISCVFGTWFLLAGHSEFGILCFCLTGSLIAFFFYNVFGKKNKIFMGDTGSLILGVIMVILVVKFNEFNINQIAPYAVQNAPVLSMSLLIIPVIDTLRVFFIRISEKRSPFRPDMNHLHHSFLKLGNSHLVSTLMIVSINVLFIAFTLALSRVLNINNLMISVLVLGFIVAYIPSYLLKYRSQASFEQTINKYEGKVEGSVRKIKIIGEPYFSMPTIDPKRKKEHSKQEVLDSAI